MTQPIGHILVRVQIGVWHVLVLRGCRTDLKNRRKKSPVLNYHPCCDLQKELDSELQINSIGLCSYNNVCISDISHTYLMLSI